MIEPLDDRLNGGLMKLWKYWHGGGGYHYCSSNDLL